MQCPLSRHPWIEQLVELGMMVNLLFRVFSFITCVLCRHAVPSASEENLMARIPIARIAAFNATRPLHLRDGR